MPTVSFIVPIYNAAKFLDECVESIRSQTMQDIEIVLVDDGSTDESSSICDRYAETDKRVKVIHKENGGVSSARNCGIDAASAEWLMFVDADDWIEPNAAEVLYKTMLETGDDIVTSGHFKNFPDHEEAVGTDIKKQGSYDMTKLREWTLGHVVVGLPESVLPDELKELHRFSIQGTLYNRHFLQDNDIYFKKIKRSEDTLFVLHTVQNAGSIYYLSTPLFHYRIWGGSVIQTFHEDQVERFLAVQEEYKIFMDKYGIEESFAPFYRLKNAEWIFELTRTFAKQCNSREEYKKYEAKLKAFMSAPACRDAAENARTDWMGKRERFIFNLVKRGKYHTALFVLHMYFSVK